MLTAHPVVRSICVAFVILIAARSFGQPAIPKDGNREIGYLPLKDHTRLAYILYRPAKEGRFPVLVIYNPYWGAGTDFGAEEKDYLQHGYAVLGVSARGTGCSEGRFHRMFESPEAEDGAQVIEWAASQPWSNGNVGMYGNSYSGIVQIMVGSLRPPHLRALAAGGLVSDLYSDAVYPGGVFNYAFLAQWTFFTQPDVSATGVALRLKAGDRDCEAIRAKRPIAGNTWQQFAAHPLKDAWWNSADYNYLDLVRKIQAPLMIFGGWQDQQAGSAGPVKLFERATAPKKLVMSNGSHSIFHLPPMRAARIRWYDRWMKGEQNGIDKEPPVSLWFDTQEQPGNQVKPGWASDFAAWPIPATKWSAMYLTADERISDHKPETAAERGVRSYVYPAASEIPYTNAAFSLPLNPVGGLLYRTAPMTEDTAVAGSPVVTLYASSDQKDTDFMIALHDLYPDGSAMYLERGFLRASERALDPAKSQPNAPVHPYNRVAELAPGKVYELKISIDPFAHVFRRGHALELAVLAPTTTPLPNWGFSPVMLPGLNTIHHSMQHPSGIALPIIPGLKAELPEPECGSLLLLPCRPAVRGIERVSTGLDEVFRQVEAGKKATPNR